LEDSTGEREEQKRKPDDEDEHEEEKSSDPVLDDSFLLHPSRCRVCLQHGIINIHHGVLISERINSHRGWYMYGKMI